MKKYLTLAKVKKALKDQQKDRDLSDIQKSVLEYTTKIGKLNITETDKLIKDLEKVDKLTTELRYKISEILPTDAVDVRLLTAKKNITLTKEEIDIVLKIVKNYLKKK